MTLAEAAPSPANLASWNTCFLGVAVAGDIACSRIRPLSQRRHCHCACRLAVCYSDKKKKEKKNIKKEERRKTKEARRRKKIEERRGKKEDRTIRTTK